MIRPGQVYETCQPVYGHADGDEYVRIKVMQAPVGLKVTVATLTTEGRLIRWRSINTSQLHESGTTKAGAPRRTGYRLVQDATAGGTR